MEQNDKFSCIFHCFADYIMEQKVNIFLNIPLFSRLQNGHKDNISLLFYCFAGYKMEEKGILICFLMKYRDFR